MDSQAHGSWHKNVLELQAGVRHVAEKTFKHFQSFPHSWKILRKKEKKKKKKKPKTPFGLDKHPLYLHLSLQTCFAKESAKNTMKWGGWGGHGTGQGEFLNKLDSFLTASFHKFPSMLKCITVCPSSRLFFSHLTWVDYFFLIKGKKALSFQFFLWGSRISEAENDSSLKQACVPSPAPSQR